MKSSILIILIAVSLNVFAQRYQKMERSFGVEVKEIKWSNDMKGYYPVNELKEANSGRELIFWARLVGDQYALEFIRNTNQLPVQFKFFKKSVLGLTPERFYVMESDLIAGGSEAGSKSMEIKLDEKVMYQKMKDLKSNDGLFEFYIWTRFSPDRLKGTDSLTASIALRDNSSVKCPAELCEYIITIR